jgi:hypothetical protein
MVFMAVSSCLKTGTEFAYIGLGMVIPCSAGRQLIQHLAFATTSSTEVLTLSRARGMVKVPSGDPEQEVMVMAKKSKSRKSAKRPGKKSAAKRSPGKVVKKSGRKAAAKSAVKRSPAKASRASTRKSPKKKASPARKAAVRRSRVAAKPVVTPTLPAMEQLTLDVGEAAAKDATVVPVATIEEDAEDRQEQQEIRGRGKLRPGQGS